MLSTHRKQLILEMLVRDGQVIAKALSQELRLSEDTIRRDMRELAAEGLVQRVHGGVMPASPTVGALAVRRSIARSEKAKLGKKAASLIRPGQNVLFDGGTSNVEIIRNLVPSVGFTAITHSPTIAVELEHHPQVEVLIIGGRLFRHSMVTTGALALEGLSRIRADVCFLGVTGLHATEGLTTGDPEEAAMKRSLIMRAGETIVLATSEKIGAVSPFSITLLSDLSAMIVADDASAEKLAPFEKRGFAVIRAD